MFRVIKSLATGMRSAHCKDQLSNPGARVDAVQKLISELDASLMKATEI